MTHAMKIALAASCALLSACSHGVRPISRDGSAMSGYVTITVYDDDIPEQHVRAAIDSAFAEIHRIEGFASDYSDSSEIGRANTLSGRDSMVVSADLADLLRMSLAYGDSSSGAFDITVGPLEALWNILAPHPRVPPADSIREMLTLVDYRRVRLHGRMLYLPREGMRLDLGGIGKGYAADRAMDVLARAGVKEALVDMDGNLAIRWPGPVGWGTPVATIDVRHPRKEGSYLGKFLYGQGGVSTSGDYERCFILDGVRYHHIMNPATGSPARGVVSVTIVAPTAADADAISTTVFVLGRQKGMEFMRRVPGVDGFIVYEQGDSLAIDFSPGFAGRLARGTAHD